MSDPTRVYMRLSTPENETVKVDIFCKDNTEQRSFLADRTDLENAIQYVANTHPKQYAFCVLGARLVRNVEFEER